MSSSSSSGRIADQDVEHEAVKLRFGQRIGPFLLDRVLRGQDEERIRELVPLAADGHLPFLHGLEQGGLRLGGRAVDLVGQDDIGENRPPEKFELPHTAGLVFLDDLGARDVRRHQVGRELDPVVAQVKRIGQRVNHQRLGQPGHANQQAMSTGKDGDQQLLEDRVLSNNNLGHLPLELVEGILEPLDGGQVIVTGTSLDRVCVAHACLPVCNFMDTSVRTLENSRNLPLCSSWVVARSLRAGWRDPTRPGGTAGLFILLWPIRKW